MLIEFRVGNYKSFKDPVTFSMVAAKIKARDKRLDRDNVFRADGDLSLLKSAGIYGANASGKSNLISAVNLMRREVIGSGHWTNEGIDVDEFRLSQKMLGGPSLFEIVFTLDGMKYRYGFEASRREIVSEWLFSTPSKKEARLFLREGEVYKLSRKFKEGRGLESKTRKDVLFLTVINQFAGEIAGRVTDWFNHLIVINGLDDQRLRDYTTELFSQPDTRAEIIRMIKAFDVGIEDIELGPNRRVLERTSRLEDLGRLFVEKPTFKTFHVIRDGKRKREGRAAFDLDANESEGTQKLFSLAGPIVVSLRNGVPLVIDEFDSRLHPLVSKAIVSLYNSKETNPKNAQLIFTTHDTNLLSNKIFRRDQIWFTEKTAEGATDLYSLAEFRLPSSASVRNDASFESDYIQGRYGAIPFVGDLGILMGAHHA